MTVGRAKTGGLTSLVEAIITSICRSFSASPESESVITHPGRYPALASGIHTHLSHAGRCADGGERAWQGAWSRLYGGVEEKINHEQMCISIGVAPRSFSIQNHGTNSAPREASKTTSTTPDSPLLVELGHGCGFAGNVLGSFDLAHSFHACIENARQGSWMRLHGEQAGVKGSSRVPSVQQGLLGRLLRWLTEC